MNKHEAYKGDSVVSEEICFDLVRAVEKITEMEDEKRGVKGEVGWEMFGRG